MKKLKISFLLCLMTLSIVSCGQISDPVRDRIEFEDEVLAVKDSMVVILGLFDKIPKAEIKNCFIDDNGNLYINNKNLGSLEDAINNNRIRDSRFFSKFSEKEKDKFFIIYAYLVKNHIDSFWKDRILNKVVFNYRITNENRFEDLRELVIINNNDSITDQRKLRNHYILEEVDGLLLIAPCIPTLSVG